MEELYLDAGFLEEADVEVFFCSALGQKPGSTACPAYLEEKPIPPFMDLQLGHHGQCGFDFKAGHEILDQFHVQIDEPIKLRGEDFFENRDVLPVIGGMSIGMPQTLQMLS